MERSEERLLEVERLIQAKQDELGILARAWIGVMAPESVYMRGRELNEQIHALEQEREELVQNCFWLALWLGWDAHDYLRTLWPGINKDTKRAKANWHTVEYALDAVYEYKFYPPTTVSRDTRTLSLGRFRKGDGYTTYWLGYAPEINALFWWDGRNRFR